jgi:hypothetical protein
MGRKTIHVKFVNSSKRIARIFALFDCPKSPETMFADKTLLGLNNNVHLNEG